MNGNGLGIGTRHSHTWNRRAGAIGREGFVN